MKVSYLSISEKRCTIQFYGCNFRCRACFAGNEGYTEVTPEWLSAKIKQFDVEEIMLAGGEPTIYKKAIVDLVKSCDTKTILSTNGHLVDGKFIQEMEQSGLDEVHIDLKAYSQSLHAWYTGQSNKNVLKAIEVLNSSNLVFEVITVFIPGLIDKEEIEKIADFLSRINNNLNYRIIRYVPVGNISRRPTKSEIKEAVTIAEKYLKSVTSSLEERRHPVKRFRVFL
jgi:pyruvate-formate lyase-activating enzyme